MTFIVTGAAGFIGSNFVKSILEKSNSKTIIALDNLTYAGNMNNLESMKNNSRLKFIKGDIKDEKILKNIFNSFKPDAVINFAAETHVDRSIEYAEDFVSTNIVGLYTLLENTRLYWQNLTKNKKSDFRFIQISTDEVFGSLKENDPLFVETTFYSPNSPYSASKASGDHLVRAWHKTFGLPTITSHCSNNYGPFQSLEKLIPFSVFNCLNETFIPIYGDGKNIRDWLFVEDHCKAIESLIEKGLPGETYNVGGNSEKTNLEVVKNICGCMDKIAPRKDGSSYAKLIKFVKDRPGHDARYGVDFSKIKSELNWFPVVEFEKGLEKTVKWYVENEDWMDSANDKYFKKWVKKRYTEIENYKKR